MFFRCFLLLLLAFKLTAQPPLLDERDGTIYPTIRIGKQVWMQENLRYAMPGATPVPGEVDESYGYLYTWKAAIQACPQGWHLPSDNEWKILERYLGMPEEELDLRNKFRGANRAIATQLAASGHWPRYDSYAPTYGKSGFNALPAGNASRDFPEDIPLSQFDEILQRQLDTFPAPAAAMHHNFISLTGFWSSTEDMDERSTHSAFIRSIEEQYIDVYRFSSGMHIYYSCRCIRNEEVEQ